MDGLQALREKYRTLQRLRVERADNGQVATRDELRELAGRFPGALRELDQLPMTLIEARLAELDAALSGAGPVPSWAGMQLAYHGWLRLAFAVRAGPPGESVEQALARVRAEHVPAPGEPDCGKLGPDEVQAIRRPPGGRLNQWVYARVALEQGGAPETVEAVVSAAGTCHARE